jgi:hypothetical protein
VTNCSRLAFPDTQQNEINIAAETKSADNKLKTNNQKNHRYF